MKIEKLMVVIIDDSKVIVERLVFWLEELTNIEKILVGFNYEDGRRIFEENKVDILILDINLPEKSGIDLLRLFKEKDYPVKKIIMITDDPSPERKETCLSLGADLFLSKFDDMENLPQIIEDIKL